MIELDQDEAKKVFDKYWKLCHDKYFDPWEHSNFYEATHGLMSVNDDLLSWREKICRKCGWYNFKPIEKNKNWDEGSLYEYDQYLKALPKTKSRELYPFRTEHAWAYQCSKCHSS